MSPPKPIMVSSNCTYPDSENPSDNLTASNEIIIGTDNDTEDDDDNIYNDYQPLPMNDLNNITDNDDSNEEIDDSGIDVAGGVQFSSVNDNSIPPITPMENTLVGQVWTGPSPVDIEMDKNKVDQVKEAMSNFTLPPSSIPEWANNIPEEQWKEQLMSRLKNRTV